MEQAISDSALALVSAGACIIYPTSTQPALGCILTSAALDNLYNVKKRPSEMPVSVGVVDLEQAANLVELTDDIPEILSSFPEGSLTIILPAKEPLDARLGTNKIAIRVVAHPTAKALLRACGPLTATSANISGTPPAATCEAAAETLRQAGHEVALVAGETVGGVPSTLIAWYSVCDLPDCASIEVLREGIVPAKEVIAWWKNRTSNSGETPGM